MRFSRYIRYVSIPSGDEGIRTLDPLLARQVLSQLSYTPVGFFIRFAMEQHIVRLSGPFLL
jgi:hypothetical protein